MLNMSKLIQKYELVYVERINRFVIMIERTGLVKFKMHKEHLRKRTEIANKRQKKGLLQKYS